MHYLILLLHYILEWTILFRLRGWATVFRLTSLAEVILWHHCKVQYHEQERFDACPFLVRTGWVVLDESLYLLKWDFRVNLLLSHLTEPIIGHVSGNLTWSIYLPIHSQSHQSPHWSLRYAPPCLHSRRSSQFECLCVCVWAIRWCGWLCASVGLSVFDPHSVSGQGVLFEQAAIMVIGWHLELCRGKPVWVLNKHREGSLLAADLCMSREGQEA